MSIYDTDSIPFDGLGSAKDRTLDRHTTGASRPQADRQCLL